MATDPFDEHYVDAAFWPLNSSSSQIDAPSRRHPLHGVTDAAALLRYVDAATSLTTETIYMILATLTAGVIPGDWDITADAGVDLTDDAANAVRLAACVIDAVARVHVGRVCRRGPASAKLFVAHVASSNHAVASSSSAPRRVASVLYVVLLHATAAVRFETAELTLCLLDDLIAAYPWVIAADGAGGLGERLLRLLGGLAEWGLKDAAVLIGEWSAHCAAVSVCPATKEALHLPAAIYNIHTHPPAAAHIATVAL